MKPLWGEPASALPLWSCLRSGQRSHHPSDRVINDEQDHSSDNRDEHAVEVEAGLAEKLEQPTSDQRSHDPKNDVEKEAFPFFIHDLAGDEARTPPA